MTPANLSDLVAQAVALHQQGKLDEAENLYAQILAAEPGHFAANHLLGVVRYQQRRHDEALALIGTALKSDPDFTEALSNYSLVLKALGRLEEALAQGDRAVALRPGFAQALNNRGIILLDLNRFEEALASYDAALAVEPDFAEAMGNRGLVLQYLGRLEEARDAYRRALALDPERANVYLDYADSGKVAAGDPHFKAMQNLKPADETGRIHLDFALAKAYADQGEHALSFEHLLRGNARKRALTNYDEAGTLQFFERIQAQFTPQFVREKERLGGDPSPAPIFILGMMRSGSTLVEQILASHPAIHGAGELPAFSQVVAAMRDPGSRHYPESVAGLDGAGLRAIGRDYVARIRKLAPDAPHITDKMPSNYFFAGLIHLALPNARIIHTLRDPVDNCLSCFSKLFIEEQNHAYDLAELGRYYRGYEKLMAHWHGVLPPGRILDVRYEELVGDLESQARRIIAHCGLPWDARCLSFHTHSRPVRTASVSQVRQPIYSSALGRARPYDAFLGPLKAALAGK